MYSISISPFEGIETASGSLSLQSLSIQPAKGREGEYNVASDHKHERATER